MKILLTTLFCLLFNPFLYSQTKIIEWAEFYNFGSWELTGKQEKFFNSSGQTDSIISYFYNSLESKFNINRKIDFWYNGFGELILTNTYNWSNNIKDWELHSRSENVIDRDSFIITKTYRSFNNGVFSISSIVKVYYDNFFKNDFRTEFYYWDSIQQDFILQAFTVNKYDEKNEIDSVYHYVRPNRFTNLKLQRLIFYNETGLNNKEQLIYSIDTNGQITLMNKVKLLYNSKKELLVGEDFIFNQIEWVPTNKVDYSYENGEILETIFSKYHSNLQSYIFRTRYRNEKVNLSLSQESPAELVYGFYPNPAKEKITFIENPNLSLIEIYDLNGRLIISKKRNSDIMDELDISQLNSGVYLVNLIDHSGLVHSKKLLKN